MLKEDWWEDIMTLENIKFHFPVSFVMTMLSWSAIEYEHKYRAIGDYDHIRDLIKWGTDYLLLTFKASTPLKLKLTKFTVRLVGQEMFLLHQMIMPEDIDYCCDVQTASTSPDLVSEVAAALAAASIVFRDNNLYSKKLVKGTTTVFTFARLKNSRTPYCRGNPFIEPFYNSTGYWDEYMWGAARMYYATGNSSYLSLATHPDLSKHLKAGFMIPDLSVLSWDNKLPAAMLLLIRMRMFLNPGYPYEDMMRTYHILTGLTMCSYLRTYN